MKAALWREGFGEAFNGSAPTQIARQMPRRDAPEGPQPSFKAAGIGVHILDVEAAMDMFAMAGDDRNLQNILCMCEGGVGLATVADEDCVLRDQRL